jgi:predicted metal-dependent hydrolase
MTLDGKIITYRVKRSSRSSHARLEIRADTGLTVIVPQSYALSRVPGIISDKKRWVKAKLELLQLGKQAYETEGACRYLGRTLKVVALDGHHKGIQPVLSGDELIFGHQDVDGRGPGVERWLRKQADTVVKEIAVKYSLKIGVRYKILRLRSARTRWGSCSPGGTLNLNWKLIMFPPPVIEYVVIHELCHLKELNHSKSFWELVEVHCPDWRIHRKWLHANEAALGL